MMEPALEVSFVTIRIFARTELMNKPVDVLYGFVTIRIFARTEHSIIEMLIAISFVTIRIFARTEPQPVILYA